MTLQKHGAFTLVELIVAVSILAILGTLGSVQYLQYIEGVRDATRISQMVEIYNGIEGYSLDKKIPLALNQNYISIEQGVNTVIGYQGDIDKKILETIDYSSNGLDPKTQEYYSFIMDKKRKNIQILGYLETRRSYNNITNQFSLAGVSAQDFFPFTYGENIGFITDSSYQSIHKNYDYSDQGKFNIDSLNDTDVFQVIYDNDFSQTVQKKELLKHKTILKQGSLYEGTCKEILESDIKFLKKDGMYVTQLANGEVLELECNMTDDGGGWTRYAEVIDQFTFALSADCYNTETYVDNGGFYCFNPHRKNINASEIMLEMNQDYASASKGNQFIMDVSTDFTGIDEIEIGSNTDGSTYRDCPDENHYMVPMSGNGESTIRYYRIGLNYCRNSRQVGGTNNSNQIMNFSNTGKGPNGGNGVSKNRNYTVVPYTFYFR